VTLILFVVGLALLIGGAEVLVRGASRLAAAAGIAPLVIGLTVVAFGTSAPELAVTTAATVDGDPALAVGNVVGSNILNILLILGLSAAVAPLVVQRRLVRLEVPLLIAVSLIVLILALNGEVSRGEGILLVIGGVVYTAALVRQARRSPAFGAVQSDLPPATAHTVLRDTVFVAAGLAFLVLGSRWLVDGARAMAAAMGLSELVIGLTVVATGTSLPELATSLVASLRGHRDIAVGNIIGSNLFNLLFILGITATIAPDGITAPSAAIRFDIPVMVAVAIACLPIFFTGHAIDRWEGFLFLGYYVAYTLYILLAAAGHDNAHGFREGLLYFALPLTAVTLGIAVLREILPRRRR